MDGVKAGKSLALESAYRLGLLETGRIMRRNKVAILCYHRFTPADTSGGAISARLFEAHLKYLVKHFTVISFKSLHHVLTGKLVVRSPLIVTVDDGYRDFAEVAVPLLRKYGVPATLFATTRFVDGEFWLWPDVIRYSLFKTNKRRLKTSDFERELPLGTDTEKETACVTLTNICKRLKETEKAEFLRQMTDELDVSIPPVPTDQFRAVSWEDLRRLDSDLIEVGSHTLTHVILSRCTSDVARTEIVESKERIERMLDREVTAFAYPNGMHGDFGDEHKEFLKEAGYRFAVSGEFGFNEPDSESFDLNRIIASYDMSHFVQEVSGFESLKRLVLYPANNVRPS